MNTLRFREKLGSVRRLLTAVSVIVAIAPVLANSKTEESKHFTAADDIRLTDIESISFSPGGRYFVVISECGRLDINRPESSLRVYRSEAVRRFLTRGLRTVEPVPFWILRRHSYIEGPNITGVRWLRDSKEFAFLAKTHEGNDQLFLADIRTRTLKALTPEAQHVTSFDIRTQREYVYTALSPAMRTRLHLAGQSAAIVGTGKPLDSLVFHQDGTPDVWVHDLSELWAVLKGRRFRVVDRASGRAIPIHLEGQRALALSPDGHQVITALTVETVPKQWEGLYPSPLPSSPYRISAKHQNPEGLNGQRDISEYARIDLVSGKIDRFIDAPIGNGLGWWGLSHADWSRDGQSVVLSDTFLPQDANQTQAQPVEPCVVVENLTTHRATCLTHWTNPAARNDSNKEQIVGADFDPEDSRFVEIVYSNLRNGTKADRFFELSAGTWSARPTVPHPDAPNSIEVLVKQGMNEPPVLLATDPGSGVSRVLWSPNSWLSEVHLANVSIFKWQDRTGRQWIGGLYKPPDYLQGKRYPLIIQTHGFDENRFQPSGAFPVPFAAQELASAGFLVLQVRDCPIRGTPEEGDCQLAGYEAAVKQLSEDGLADQNRVGIIGFSRTCYYVLHALTAGKIRFKAASITDGVNEGYLQYLLSLDVNATNSIAREAEAMIGAPPFGQGLEKWFESSPLFKMDRVTAPLQVVATRDGILQMWEPYAALRYLNKPVELLVLNSDEHIVTNPRERLFLQSATVDWFRFWLLGHTELDSGDPRRLEHWEAMRKLMHSRDTTTTPF